MPYRSIDTERKVKLILEHLRGARICFLARRYSVNEDSIHLWKNKVLQALSEILSPVTGERTSRSLRISEKGTVQRFRCSECGVKLYLVKKKSKMEK